MDRLDPAGAFTRATGRSVEEAGGRERYRAYQFALIAPHCGRSVLEVGSGLGEFAAQFTALERLVVTDVDPLAVDALRRRFEHRSEVEVELLDLGAEPSPAERVETVVAINVLEHIEDDVDALQRLASLTVPGGTIVLWVPGYPVLYGDFDRRVGHVRRYTPASLRRTVVAAGLAVERCHPVNLLGGIAWWVAVRLGGTGSPRPRMVAAYDRLVVPATRLLERVHPPPFGQTVLCVARTAP